MSDQRDFRGLRPGIDYDDRIGNFTWKDAAPIVIGAVAIIGAALYLVHRWI